MRSTSPRLLIPPVEQETVYPYARVWRGIAIIGLTLFAVALVLFFVGPLLPPLSRTLVTALDVIIALLPALLWVVFALLPEARALEPRRQLLATFLIAGLVANGVVLPLVEVIFQPERWLPLSDAVTRIIGYTITVGMAQELGKYLVVRSLAWNNLLRVRMDAVAYSAAAAIGYATALNLVTLLNEPAAPGPAALTAFTTVALSLAPSFILAYGIGETRCGTPTAFLLPLTFALAALVYGTAITLRGSFVNASLTLSETAQVSAPSPLFGLLIPAALTAAVGIAVAFLISNAERREAESRLEG